MPVITDWVYAKSASGWDMPWAGLLGGLPKLTIVCGRCSRQSRSRAIRATGGAVFVWCGRCGVANVICGLEVGHAAALDRRA